MTDNQPRYTTKRLHDEIAKARAYGRLQALEEAAVIVGDYAGKQSPIAAAVRALMGTPPAEHVVPTIWGIFTVDGRFTNLVGENEEDAQLTGEEYFTKDFIVRPLYEQPAPAERVYPHEMTDDLRDILSMMMWNTGPMAHALRAGGQDIKRKAEEEQAEVLHWLIGLALEHGSEWRSKASDRIREIRDARAALSSPMEGGE